MTDKSASSHIVGKLMSAEQSCS